MRIRIITIGISLSKDDFTSAEKISLKIKHHADILHDLKRVLTEVNGYEVMNTQITLNSFEHWLPLLEIRPGSEYQYDLSQVNDTIDILEEELLLNGIKYCSIGGIRSSNALELVPHILRRSSRIHIGCSLDSADNDLAQVAAETLMELAHSEGEGHSKLDGGRFALSFNCPANAPYPSVAYHANGTSSCVSVGLECGDLLFLAFHGVTDFNKAAQNLAAAYRQMLSPINTILEDMCCAHGVGYGGIDPTVNPGSSLYDSVVLGMEQLPPYRFGAKGSLQVAAAISRAMELLATSHTLKLCGLNGMILSPLTDIVLAQRCTESAQVASGVMFPVVTPPMRPALAPAQPSPVTFTLQDVIALCALCGGGMDWTPIAGVDASVDSLSAVLMDLHALSCGSKKPIFCRFIVMDGVSTGESTNIAEASLSPPVVSSSVLLL